MVPAGSRGLDATGATGLGGGALYTGRGPVCGTIMRGAGGCGGPATAGGAARTRRRRREPEVRGGSCDRRSCRRGRRNHCGRRRRQEPRRGSTGAAGANIGRCGWSHGTAAGFSATGATTAGRVRAQAVGAAGAAGIEWRGRRRRWSAPPEATTTGFATTGRRCRRAAEAPPLLSSA